MNAPAHRPFRGGRVFPGEDAADDAKPQSPRLPCFAAGCPMPGTLFANSTSGAGSCAWHYAVQPSDIPKVTQRLNDWACVSTEVNAARRVLTGEAASDPRAQEAALLVAWQRLAPQVEHSGWTGDLQPASGEHLGEWCRRLERFIGARVVEVLSTHRRGLA